METDPVDQLCASAFSCGCLPTRRYEVTRDRASYSPAIRHARPVWSSGFSLPRPVSLKAALPRRWQQRYEGQEGSRGVKSGSDYDIKADYMGCRRKHLVKTN